MSSCHTWDNFTTYFNTYYNAERLKKEAESEFEYQDEKKRITPRVVVPEPPLNIQYDRKEGIPPFLKEFIISQQKRQPVKVKLDSILIKGSKILAKHPKSDYIEGTLYLMATAYFYQNAWLNSQIKCSELIDKFPDGELSPDAHLLISINLLIQRKFHAGKLLLSRTVDVAWKLKRFDILSEAFRIEAELALYQHDMQGAIRPYKQAIAQSDDGLLKAKWQVDMASLLYRMNKFEEAAAAFKKVEDYDPDYLGTFESRLYYAASIGHMGRYEEANAILDDLYDDGKFEEWQSFVFAEKMTLLQLQDKLKEYETAEAHADTAFVGSPAFMSTYFQKAVMNFKQDHYSMARKYFSRARSQRTHIKQKSQRLYKLLNKWEQKRAHALPPLQQYQKGNPLTDSAKSVLALNLFELARIHDQLGNVDSTMFYYQTAIDIAPPLDNASARYYYAYARYMEVREPSMSDSLMELVVERYSLTEFGQDAMLRQGYTEAFVIDTVAELYQSGSQLRVNHNYNYAIRQFLKIFHGWPKNKLAPKALYSVGWTFENDIRDYDSAYYYYKLLVDSYPKSEYAKDIQLSLAYMDAVNSGEPIPDSLQKIKRTPRKKKDDNLFKQKMEKLRKLQIDPNDPNRNKGSFDPMNIINNPGDAFKSAKDAVMSKPGDMLKNAKNQVNSVTNIDSIKGKAIPKIELPSFDMKKDKSVGSDKKETEKQDDKNNSDEKSDDKKSK